MRVYCGACGKVNPTGRARCMYCEIDLSAAAPAGDEVPVYLARRRRGFPWGKLLFVLVLLGAAGYGAYLWFGPFWERFLP